jgi:hypothetical protein
VITGGLSAARKMIDKASDIMENSPKKEIKSNISVSYESKGSDGAEESKNVEIPLSFAIPEIDSSDFDPSEFLDDIASDFPKYEEVVSAETKYGLSDEQLKKEYKSCAESALADARAKAEKQAADKGLKIDGVASVSQSSGMVAKAGGQDDGSDVKIEVRLDVVFNAK